MGLQTKTSLSPDAVGSLQKLIQENIDSRDGLTEAAGKIDDVTLAAALEQVALERNDQISELRTLVAANAEEPPSGGSASASVRRAWMDLRAAVGGGPAAILQEAERGEDHINASYEEALEGRDVEAVRDVLQRQHVTVKKSHDRIRELRDDYLSR
jgi:uncharacterized protein (TIGR02284 family)